MTYNYTLAQNLAGLDLHDGLPYAHISRDALEYYEALGFISKRPDEQGKYDITAEGREFIQVVSAGARTVRQRRSRGVLVRP